MSKKIVANKFKTEHFNIQTREQSKIILTASSLLFGTLQIQLVPKFVSRVWIQRKQQRFS